MISVKFNSAQFAKDMNNIVNYSVGFLDGAKAGKKELLENIGGEVIRGLKEFIDANARVSPNALHHIYEWHQTGSPDARLFDIEYIATNVGLSFGSTFRQSVSVKNGSKVPFYDKARIMESGIPVTIRPRQSSVLSFVDNGEQVFTKKPIDIANPGGDATKGSYERVFNQFFDKYFRQSFLKASGILDHLNNPEPFKKNFGNAKRGGKAAGFRVGYRWIAKKAG